MVPGTSVDWPPKIEPRGQLEWITGSMLVSAVARPVQICMRFPWVVISLVLGCSIAAAAYSASHFAITTDVNKLISSDLPWRQREAAFERQFPAHFQSTLVVVDAPTPELAAAASAELQQKLQG